MPFEHIDDFIMSTIMGLARNRANWFDHRTRLLGAIISPSWFASVNRAFYIVSLMLSRMLSTVHASTSICEHHLYALPS